MHRSQFNSIRFDEHSMVIGLHPVLFLYMFSLAGLPLMLDPLRYYVLNKPRGIITANIRDLSSPNTPTFIELLQEGGLQDADRLFAVGLLSALTYYLC